MDYSIRPGKKVEIIGEVLNKEKPIISIITPHYNGKKTVQETANSVFSQTFPFFEWIIVDDGSTDKESLDIIRNISKMDKRIKLFEKENGGPATARDFGIYKASKETKYIFFLDVDDIIDKNALEIFYWSLETHLDYSFVYTKMINFGAQEFIWEKYLTVEEQKKENLICISSMIRKEDLLEVGCFGIKEKAMYEDWNLWLKLIAAGKKPIRLTAPVFWYRFSNTGELSRAKENHIKAMKYVINSAKTIKKEVDILNFPCSGKKEDKFNKELDVLIPDYKKSKQKTILLILPWTVKGGADVFNLELIKRMDKEKFKFIVLSTLPTENILWQEFNQNASEYFDLASFLERKDYLSFIDYIINSRKVDIVFSTHSKYGYSFIPYIKAKYPDIPIIDYIHSVDFRDKTGGFAKLSFDYESFINNTYTCNNFTTKQLIKDFSKKKVDTIYIGTDEKKFDINNFDIEDLRYKYLLPKEKTIVTFIARLSSEKRPLLFVEIANEIIRERADVHFVIAGDGPLYNEVQNYIKNKNIEEYFSILGMSNNPEEIYAISDITVNCSILEGIALTAFESLSMGIPVIASNVGGQSELIDNSVGRLIPYIAKPTEKQIKEEKFLYVKAIYDVINNIDDYKKEARQKITTKFTLDNMIKAFEKIFDNIKPINTRMDINMSIVLYEIFLINNYNEFDYLVKDYYETKFGYDVASPELKKSDRKLVELKNNLKGTGIKYYSAEEFKTIFDFLKSSILLSRAFKPLFIALKNFFLYLFKSILSAIIIVIRFLKLKLGITKIKKKEQGKILICFEKTEIGVEGIIILNQAIELRQKGFDVYIMSSNILHKEILNKLGIRTIEQSFNDDSLNMSKTKQIARFIEDNKINQVIINQFNCAFSVLGACLMTKTPYTLYLHMSDILLNEDNIFDFYENKYPIFKDLFKILFDNSYKIISNIEELSLYINKNYKVDKDKILIKNDGLSFNLYNNKSNIKDKKSFILFPTVNDKSDILIKKVIDFFLEYNKYNRESTLKIVFEDNKNRTTEKYIKEVNNFDTNIEILYEKGDNIKLIENSDIVLGAERNIIEAIAMKRIPILIQSKDIKGIIDNNNIHIASRDDFKGKKLVNQNVNELAIELYGTDMNRILSIIESNYLFVKERFNIEKNIYFIPKAEIKKYNQNSKYIFEDVYALLEKYYKEYAIQTNKIDGKLISQSDYETYTEIINGKIYKILYKVKKVFKNDTKH